MKEIEKEHKDIYEKVQLYLIRSQGIPLTAPIFKRYSTTLRNYLQQCYLTPLSHKDQTHARQQAQVATSIRTLLRKKNLEKKAQKFFSDTNAFLELSDNPFRETLNSVVQLLNKLRREKRIFKWQHEQMMPDQATCELAHLYFNPKTHKVQRKCFYQKASLWLSFVGHVRMAFLFDPSKIRFMLQQRIFQSF
jgi:hypothetical protein